MMAAVVVPNLMGRTDEARIAAAQTDIQTIMSALKLYNLDNSRFPTAEQGLAALVERPTLPPEPRNYKKGGYLERLPMDPWGNPYQYLNPGLHGKEVEVYSFGRDGTAGGEGIDADIGSW
ncbi:MAG: type II secretion system major pseudopilin GspG [Burkholderiales bacterium]|jgi:general secretion pathway protein G|nr:type II secretion system major pseudopilin GspG [Burkholderiales bacterium]